MPKKTKYQKGQQKGSTKIVYLLFGGIILMVIALFIYPIIKGPACSNKYALDHAYCELGVLLGSILVFLVGLVLTIASIVIIVKIVKKQNKINGRSGH